MIRRKGPILATAVIAAFALGWYQGLFGIDPVDTDVAPAAPERAGPQVAASGSKAPGVGQSATPEAAVAGAPPAPASGGVFGRTEGAGAGATAPGFDVVRVEPDGSAVVAGKGVANQSISLTDGKRTLGEAQTDANGDFVMALSIPSGSHRLQLAQRDDVVSDEAAVVNVPPAGRPDQLLVMMERPGEASEVLQKPTETAEPAGQDRAAERSAEQIAAVEQSQSSATPPATATAPATVDPGISVEAVEIEGDRLFVAGSAAAKAEVRIYLDDRFVSGSRSGEGDRFVASAAIDVPVGDHMIRADVVDAAGRVLGRVEVPFQRPEGVSMAAIAPPASERAEAADTMPSTQRADPEGPEVVGVTPPSTPDAPMAERAEEPQAVMQAPLQAAASRVIIRRGDTLWRISRDTYGRGSRYTVIYLANGDQIRDPNRIYPGQVFRMPDSDGDPQPPRG